MGARPVQTRVHRRRGAHRPSAQGAGPLTPELVGFLRFDALRAQTPLECLRAVEAHGRAADAGGVLPNPTRLVLAGHALNALLSDGGRLDEVSAGELLDPLGGHW